MAPHDTDTPKEARRHAVPLIGMGVCLAIALVGFLWWVSYALQGKDESEPAPAGTQTTQPAY